VSLADTLEHFGRAAAAGRTGKVEVGFNRTLLFRGLAAILKSLRESFPQIDLSVRQLAPQVQVDLLRIGRPRSWRGIRSGTFPGCGA
jgi:hypothetical protein